MPDPLFHTGCHAGKQVHLCDHLADKSPRRSLPGNSPLFGRVPLFGTYLSPHSVGREINEVEGHGGEYLQIDTPDGGAILLSTVSLPFGGAGPLCDRPTRVFARAVIQTIAETPADQHARGWTFAGASPRWSQVTGLDHALQPVAPAG